MSKLSAVEYNGFSIHCHRKGCLVCITDMWKAEGSPSSKRPQDWIELQATQQLLQSLSSKSAVTALLDSQGRITSAPKILERQSGRYGGTYAIRELALDYAQFLSVEFHQWALTALVERVEEELDPDLSLERGYSRAVKGWKKQGYSDEDIELLAQSVITRKDFTSTLKDHGVGQNLPRWIHSEDMAYAVATNSIYKPLLPGTAKDYRTRNNLPAKTNVREHLAKSGDLTKRAAIMLAETMAREKIQNEDRHGFTPCNEACADSGSRVARVFE